MRNCRGRTIEFPESTPTVTIALVAGNVSHHDCPGNPQSPKSCRAHLKREGPQPIRATAGNVPMMHAPCPRHSDVGSETQIFAWSCDSFRSVFSKMLVSEPGWAGFPGWNFRDHLADTARKTAAAVTNHNVASELPEVAFRKHPTGSGCLSATYVQVVQPIVTAPVSRRPCFCPEVLTSTSRQPPQ